MSKMNLLLVEDATIYLILLQQLFESHFNVFSTKNVPDAISLVADNDYSFDVVVLDLITPGALNLIRQIKKAPRLSEVPIVVLTVGEDPNNQIQAFDFGAYDYITKPIHNEIVLKRVLNAAQYYSRMKELVIKRDALANATNIDNLTKIYNLDTAKWLVNEKIHESPTSIKAFMLFKIIGLKDVYEEEGTHRGDDLVQDIGDFISTHFRNIDILGRISSDTFIAFVDQLINEDAALLKKLEMLRLFKQKKMTDIPEDIVLQIGVATSNEETTYEKLYEKAESYLNQETIEGF